MVEKIWEAIFLTADKILKVHLKFGFEQFNVEMNPRIEHVALALNVLDSLLDTFHASGTLEHSETRMIFNAKQQILLVQRVAEALQKGSREDYTVAIEQMRAQAVF